MQQLTLYKHNTHNTYVFYYVDLHELVRVSILKCIFLQKQIPRIFFFNIPYPIIQNRYTLCPRLLLKLRKVVCDQHVFDEASKFITLCAVGIF